MSDIKSSDIKSSDKELELFKDKLFAEAKKKGFAAYEMYLSRGASFSVKVFEGAIREYKNAGDSGLSFRGIWNGKMGYAYSERIGDDIIPFLVENAAQNAEIIEDTDIEDLFEGSSSYPAVQTWDEALAGISTEAKIHAALAMEKAAKDADSRVKAVDYCQLGTGENEIVIANSLGLNISQRDNSAQAWSVPRVQAEDGQVKQNGDVWAGKDLKNFDAAAFGKRSAEIALSYLGAKSVASGKYPVIFTPNAMSDLLATFAGVFSAEEAQKGFSLLKGKTGEKIASGIVTLRDDPLLDQKPGSAAFDSEGVAAKNKAIIEGGIFRSFLHNRKTAKKDGVEPTGNGFKYSFKSSVAICPTNFYIVPSEKSQDELIAETGEGLLISDLAGLHSGANSVSGDFSVSAEGHLISGGKKGRAIEQITIAGNFFTLLGGITGIGGDLEFKGNICSPSIAVKELDVAGEEKNA
ncbi:peptidase [Spirochaetia bacterium]|nr:peptidase [Spirochaetia bacterium]